MALLHIHRLGDDELGIEPGRLGALQRGRLQDGPGPGVLVAELHALLPVRAVRARRHAPQRVALVVHRVVASDLGATMEAVNAVYQKICCATLPWLSAGSDW